MEAVDVDILVLNHNCRALLAECLPSVVRAAANSRYACRVTLVDNASTDDSCDFVAREFTSVLLVSMPNLGLCSFNKAVAACTGRVVLLLNNDIRLADDAIDPLVDPLISTVVTDEPVFLTAPQCVLFDGVTHEGFQAAVGWRFGLVQATSLFPGAESVADRLGPTASAGAAIAVDRRAFLELGGFDPLYLPGRIEDLDFCFRGFLAGYRALYIPSARAWHRGAASFGPAFGRQGCLGLATRNTLLFQWKNLQTFRHRLRGVASLPLRFAWDAIRSVGRVQAERFPFRRAYREARRIWRTQPRSPAFARPQGASYDLREREFFARHTAARLRSKPIENLEVWRGEESRRAARYPVARWYLRPLCEWAAFALRYTPVAPWQITCAGSVFAVTAAVKMLVDGAAGPAAALLILVAYFFDRLDGPLARLKKCTTPLGAWLDANVDEAVDLGLHACTAAVASRQWNSSWPWMFLVGFLVGKYLLMYGLHAQGDVTALDAQSKSQNGRSAGWLRRLYHLPANSDVRMHLLIVATATGLLVEELAAVACYYNLRWPLRYVLVAKRMSGAVAVRGAA